MGFDCYWILRNGLIIQWGKVDNGTSGGTTATTTFTFPVAYTSAPCVLKTANYDDSSTGTTNVKYLSSWCFVYNISTTGFRAGRTDTSIRPFSWIAIGY